jgi:diaminohydroxyphosphoribosylaminopyrimidine deaminase/5-amino-6-(5-phosphoribosylamino)uracil reductase
MYLCASFFCAPELLEPEGAMITADSTRTLVVQRAMRRANKLSEAGLGLTAPNPIVGAVILDADGQEIASGFHSGGDHAEVVAIKAAKSRGFTDFSEFTMAVTLEPCNHHGKTGPCSEAIINAGFKSVAFAVSDPNPVAHGGAATLRKAGIDVVDAIEEEAVAFTNRAWLKKMKSGKPWFVTKIAATLDGKIAASDETSQWITSDDARRDVAILRNQSDAIVTTTATALADNPDLTPRFEDGINPSGRIKNPVRIVMGKRAVPTEFALHNDRAETQFIDSHDFDQLLEMAQRSGWNQVMIEAGSTFNSALIRAGLIDEIVLYQAPSLLGAGRNFVSDLGINTLNDRISYSYGEIIKVGSDLRIQLLKQLLKAASKDRDMQGAQ